MYLFILQNHATLNFRLKVTSVIRLRLPSICRDSKMKCEQQNVFKRI